MASSTPLTKTLAVRAEYRSEFAYGPAINIAMPADALHRGCVVISDAMREQLRAQNPWDLYILLPSPPQLPLLLPATTTANSEIDFLAFTRALLGNQDGGPLDNN